MVEANTHTSTHMYTCTYITKPVYTQEQAQTHTERERERGTHTKTEQGNLEKTQGYI